MEFNYLSSEAVPQVLYHYTSLEALVSIVKSRRIRATNIRFLNDTSESLRLKEDVAEVLRANTDLIDTSLATPMAEAVEKVPLQNLYVASFTQKADLLSQWRAYCPPGLGVSIGFHSSSLQQQWIWNPGEPEKPHFLHAPLQNARYYGEKHRPALEETVLRWMEIERTKYLVEVYGKLLPHHLPGIPSTVLPTWVALLAPFIKHEAFEEEQEWRKVVSKDYRAMPGVQFRQGKSTLIPYVELMLDATPGSPIGLASESYFIKDVVIGPTPNPELTSEALISLFTSEGHPEVQVRSSEIPYKSW